jgi:RNA polymerase sigma-70 factor (ECF subfamily)
MSSFDAGLVTKLEGAVGAFTTNLEGSREADVPRCLRDAVRQYARYVIGLLGRLGVAPADVEDVAQEVYLAIHAQLPSFEARISFKTWLCGVCRHKAADYRRKRARRRSLTHAQPVELPREGDCPHDVLQQQEAKETLRRAIAQLPDEQLEVFVLHAVEDLPMRDVAALMGSPIDTAYTRYRVAVQRIKAMCERKERAGRVP